MEITSFLNMTVAIPAFSVLQRSWVLCLPVYLVEKDSKKEIVFGKDKTMAPAALYSYSLYQLAHQA